MGRKSVSELKRILGDLLRRRLAKLISADQLPHVLTIDSLTGDFDPELTASLINIYPSLSQEIISPIDPQYLLEDDTDVREQIARIIDALPKKEKDVLLRRFGLQGHRPKTLEEIGNEFYVTRERVRQVEAKAISPIYA
jgi:RNA polymerase sigma factor (sigma-70 family)